MCVPHNGVIPSLFVYSMKTAERQYIEAFEDELRSFLLRVQQRAQVRIENAMKEAEAVREPHALVVM